MYIAGGIVPRFTEFFKASGFRGGFEDKGRFKAYVQDIPVYLIVHDNPGLLGSGAHLRQTLGSALSILLPGYRRSPDGGAFRSLQIHQLAKLFHFTATDRNLKLRVTQAQHIGVVEPRLNFPNFAEIYAIRAVAAEEMRGGQFAAEFSNVHRHDE